MSRFLFVVAPFRGHVNRVDGVAAELEARGHAVAWLGPAELLRPLLREDSGVYDLRGETYDAVRAQLAERRPFDRPVIIELGLAAVEAAEATIDDFRPDVVVIDRPRPVGDELTLAGTLAARRRELPWATAGWAPVPSQSPEPEPDEEPPIDLLHRELGLEPLDWPYLSPHLVLVFESSALIGEDAELPSHYLPVGPAFGPRKEDAEFPWDELGPRPRVLVTFGSVHRARGSRFYRATAEALDGSDVRVVLAAPLELIPEPPDNVLVREEVPQLALLAQVDAVVCHAGLNTVNEALAHGLPLVLAPIAADQPLVAEHVVQAGAGILVDGRVPSPRAIREAVNAVLTEPGYRQAAERIRASFEEAGGAKAAADALERLAG